MFVCPPPLARSSSLLLRFPPSVSRHITHAVRGGSEVRLTLTLLFFFCFLFCNLSVHVVLNANAAIICVFSCFVFCMLITGDTITEMEVLLFPVNSLLTNAHSFPSFALHWLISLTSSFFHVFHIWLFFCFPCRSLCFDWALCFRQMSEWS